MDIGFHEHSIISISVKKDWEYINITRDYIGYFLSINSYDEWTISKVQIALSELLENAVQHSSKESINLSLLDITDETSKGIAIQVKNYTGHEHANDLLQRLDDMADRPTLEYYIKCLRESKLRKRSSQTPGCGLARIYHEGQALLKAEYDSENEVILVESLIPV